MAFVPSTSFLRPFSRRAPPPQTPPCPAVAPRRATIVAAGVPAKDAMDFFRHREGKWHSVRFTHHLAFRRSENGESEITMRCLEPSDPRVAKLCTDWEEDPAAAHGGCHVTWRATMAWDQEGENHDGETIFALVPTTSDRRAGKILRDRGYAEIVPIAGTYEMDEDDALILETPYQGGAVSERFMFEGPDVVNRVSTVQRFGGYSTATFAFEQRVRDDAEGEGAVEGVASTRADGDDNDDDDDDDEMTDEQLFDMMRKLSLFSAPEEMPDSFAVSESTAKPRVSRWGAPIGAAPAGGDGKPSANSAFGSGFSGSGGGGTVVEGAKVSGGNGNGSAAAPAPSVDGVPQEVVEAAARAGIDLNKVPPSMRDDFLASFDSGDGKE